MKFSAELSGGLDGAHSVGQIERDFCGCCSRYDGDIATLKAGANGKFSGKASWTHGNPVKFNGWIYKGEATGTAIIATTIPIHLIYDS